jgi:hypothetical protein
LLPADFPSRKVETENSPRLPALPVLAIVISVDFFLKMALKPWNGANHFSNGFPIR